MISAELGIPVESIEPIQDRCLQTLRSHPAVAALVNAETGERASEMPGQATA